MQLHWAFFSRNKINHHPNNPKIQTFPLRTALSRKHPPHIVATTHFNSLFAIYFHFIQHIHSIFPYHVQRIAWEMNESIRTSRYFSFIHSHYVFISKWKLNKYSTKILFACLIFTLIALLDKNLFIFFTISSSARSKIFCSINCSLIKNVYFDMSVYGSYIALSTRQYINKFINESGLKATKKEREEKKISKRILDCDCESFLSQKLFRILILFILPNSCSMQQ